MPDDDDALDALLDAIELCDERGDVAGLAAAVARARRAFPDAIEPREWEATLALDDGRTADALAVLDAILAVDPDNGFARRERGAALVDVGRFADALADLDAVPRAYVGALPPQERAVLHHERALCLDRAGRAADADREFAVAARLAPDEWFVPPRHSPEAFERAVADALDTIPAAFRPYLAQVVVGVQPWPPDDADDPFQLGLYDGIPRPDRTVATADHLDHVVVFQRPHEIACPDDAALREEIRKTVVHELAHHFGLDDGDLGDYE